MRLFKLILLLIIVFLFTDNSFSKEIEIILDRDDLNHIQWNSEYGNSIKNDEYNIQTDLSILLDKTIPIQHVENLTAAASENKIVLLYKDTFIDRLMYCIGHLEEGRVIEWYDPVEFTNSGECPAIAIEGENIVVVYKDNNSVLFYNTGKIIDDGIIDWVMKEKITDSNKDYDYSVSLGNDQAIVVYRDEIGLWYQIGTLEGNGSISKIGCSASSSKGQQISLSADGNNVFEVYIENNIVYSRKGSVTEIIDGSISLDWKPRTKIANTGSNPSIATDGYNIVVTYTLYNRVIYYKWGILNDEDISWCDIDPRDEYLGDNRDSVVACLDDNIFIEIHNDGFDSHYCLTGNVGIATDRLKNEMENASEGDTIRFSSSMKNATIFSIPIDIKPGKITVDGRYEFEEDCIVQQGKITLCHLAEENHFPTYFIRCDGVASDPDEVMQTFKNLVFTDIHLQTIIGAVHVAMKIENCTFSNCNSLPVYSNFYIFEIDMCSFINNAYSAIHFSGGTIKNSTFRNNLNSRGDSKVGGAIRYGYVQNCRDNDDTIENCIFDSNYSTEGGAIYANHEHSRLRIADCRFVNNTAEKGGALYIAVTDAVIDKCTFVNNESSNRFAPEEDDGGGAIFIKNLIYEEPFDFYNRSLLFTGEKTLIENNIAENKGGGIFWDGHAPKGVDFIDWGEGNQPSNIYPELPELHKMNMNL